MRQPLRWFELFVRVTFPGGLLHDVEIRFLILWALPLVAVLGLGLGLLGGRSDLSVIGGGLVLLGLAIFLLAYGWTVRYVAKVDRAQPDGRHARS